MNKVITVRAAKAPALEADVGRPFARQLVETYRSLDFTFQNSGSPAAKSSEM